MNNIYYVNASICAHIFFFELMAKIRRNEHGNEGEGEGEGEGGGEGSREAQLPLHCLHD